jgi:hypothetical protein
LYWILGSVLWLVIVIGAGIGLGRHDAGVEWIPELRFAGVDVVYALRRVVGEDGRILVVDEVKPRGVFGDLQFRRVDVDLRSAPLEEMLRQLRGAGGGFDFEVGPKLVYVRANMATDVKTDLDVPGFPEGKFEGTFEELVRAIMVATPKMFLRTRPLRAPPAYKKYAIEVPSGSSVIDVLLQFAEVSGMGWYLSRAGYEVGEKDGGTLVQASSVRLWLPLSGPRPLPANRSEYSTSMALAKMSQRTGVPVCVFDRSLLGFNRGALDHEPFIDPDLPIAESLDVLANKRGIEYYSWEWADDIAVVKSRIFKRAPRKYTFVLRTLRGGRFSGTLGEFARFINSNLEEPRPEIVMGGEILPGDPVTTLEIAPGTTIQEALIQFAQQSGSCWYYVSLDRLEPPKLEFPEELPEHSFLGGFLSPIQRWAVEPEWTLY